MTKKIKTVLVNSLAKFIAIAIIVGIVAGVLLLISMFGGVIMRLFGLEYRSVGSVILFFVLVMVLSIPVNMIAEVLPKVLLKEFHTINLLQARLLYLVLDTLCSMLCFSLVDYFMESVRAGDLAIFMVSLIFALIGVKDIKE